MIDTTNEIPDNCASKGVSNVFPPINNIAVIRKLKPKKTIYSFERLFLARVNHQIVPNVAKHNIMMSRKYCSILFLSYLSGSNVSPQLLNISGRHCVTAY